MDDKVYVWLKDNIEKYSYPNDKAVSVKNAFLTFFQNDGRYNDKGVEEAYNNFVESFYNNIIGYKNGFSDLAMNTSGVDFSCAETPDGKVPIEYYKDHGPELLICADELDCYFIETSDGKVPVGFYKEQRPVEASMLISKYIEQCCKQFSEKEVEVFEGWYSKIDAVSVKYEDKKDLKYSGIFKCILSLSLSLIVFILSTVSFFMSGGFSAFKDPMSDSLVQQVQQTMPCLARSDASIIKAFAVIVFIIAIGTLCTSLFLAWEYKQARDKKTTDQLLGSSDQQIEKIKTVADDEVASKTEELMVAARQGGSLKVTVNENAQRIRNIERSITVAEKFVKRRSVYSHIAVVITLGFLTVFMVVCFTNLIPTMQKESVYTQAVELLENKKYTEAESKFRTIETYKDSKDKLLECKYGEANKLLNDGEFEQAKAMFVDLADYKDSSTLVKECDYRTALKYIDDEEFLEAYDLFKKIRGYKDSENKIKSLKPSLYEKGVSLYNNGEYAEAQKHFAISVDYDREADYLRLIDIRDGAIFEMSELYELIDFADVKELLLEDEFIYEFLEGRWTDGSGEFLNYQQNSNGSYTEHCSLPSDDGDNFKLSNGYHYKGSSVDGWENQWHFKIIDVDTIEVYCYGNGEEYVMSRR